MKRTLKRYLPASLFGRALLILLLPMLLMQALAAYVFFERHWDSVQRNMSASLAGEIAMLVNGYREQADAKSFVRLKTQAANMGIHMARATPRREDFVPGYAERAYRTFYRQLRRGQGLPVQILSVNKGNDVLIVLKLSETRLLKFQTSRKRIASSTTSLVVVWMLATSLLLTTVAVLFLRNQIRPIVQLARAAERFGMGQEAVDFSPRGAAEVRKAGRALLIMRDRLRRQMASRTEMLAGISHDLRTPLTRMQLQIAMAPLHEAQKKTLEDDIAEMRHMIQEYLDFARGDAGEQTESLEITALTRDVVARYTGSGRAVYLQSVPDAPVMLSIRPQAVRRLLANLIDNALRYGQRAVLSVEASSSFVRIRVEDAGPGIPEEAIESMFRPFTRLEASRNSKTGGVGLGLSIARDIAHSHGGEITLENLRDPEGGVRGLLATLRLPRQSA